MKHSPIPITLSPSPDLQHNLAQLANIAYPGRGIVQGLAADGQHALQVYWLAGRSPSSKSRILKAQQQSLTAQAQHPLPPPKQPLTAQAQHPLPPPKQPLTAQAQHPLPPPKQSHNAQAQHPLPPPKQPHNAQAQHPLPPPKQPHNAQLLFYTAMSHLQQHWVVANGEHTNTLLEAIQQHRSPLSAIAQLRAEPDIHHTPRIAAGITPQHQQWIAIVKQHNQSCQHLTYCYQPPSSTALGIHTYQNNGDPLPPFQGSPLALPLFNPQQTADIYWQHLNPQTRVALAVRAIDLQQQTCRFYFPLC